MKLGDTWYRYDSYQESQGYIDMTGEYIRTGSKTKLRLTEFTVTKLTPKGVILDNHYFVNNSWHKKLAYPSIEMAAESFIRRKKKERSIYLARIRAIEASLELIRKKQQ